MAKANSTQYKLYWRTPPNGEFVEILPPDFEDLVQARDWVNQRVAKYPNDEFHIDQVKTNNTGAEISRVVLYTQATWVG